MKKSTRTGLKHLALAAALLCAASAQAQQGRSTTIGWIGEGAEALTGNNTAPSNWRVTPGMTFNGYSFEGNARINFDGFVCSGTLLSGGQYLLTAAHCADGFTTMTISFGTYGGAAAQVRTPAQVWVHPQWTGALSQGTDIAVIRLNAPVTGITGFDLSRTNDVGREHLIMGHGTTGIGNATSSPNWGDYGWAHYGFNTFDTTSKAFDDAWDGSGNNTFGDEYVVDYDSSTNGANHNTLQRVADLRGASFTSGLTLGANEALIAGGDSGGGDFVWDGSRWLLSGVHSWGWQFCGGRITPTCDFSSSNSSSWGDLSGSTAVFRHVDWIESITGPIPEPSTWGLMALGLLAVGSAARRRAQRAG